MTSVVRWERSSTDAGDVVTLILDDPRRSANTVSEAYIDAMTEAVDRLERERERIAGVIVTSAKKSFLAGANLAELVSAGPGDRQRVLAQASRVRRLQRRLETLGRPVVAAINGSALGGGLELALACHHRVVLDDPSVRLGLPEVTLGLMPGAGGVTRTVRLLGLATALTELLLRGQRLRPAQALTLGLAHELAADRDDLMAKAHAFIAAHQDPESCRQPYDSKSYKVPGGTPSTPALAQMLPAFPATLRKQLKGAPYPAPEHILAAAVEGLQVDLEAALTIEARYFVDLVCGQTSTNMIQALWFDLNRVNGGRSRPADVEPVPVTKVGVLGAGMMGAGIAYVLAKAGLPVVLKDVSVEAAAQGKAHSEKLLDAAVAKGRTTAGDAERLLARITPTAEVADLAGCDVVIEAVFEDSELKRRVFAEVAQVVTPGALLCSNTSTLPITGLAAGVDRPEDFIGMHFFSPVDKMPLVELIVGARTSDRALARAHDLARRIGKTPIVVNDSRGFFTSRVFGTLVLEGAALLAEGMPAPSVERAALRAGFPAGPLTLLDEVTLTLPLKIHEQAVAAARTGGESEPDEHPGLAVLRALVERDRTGKAAGAGFYDWGPDGKRVWPGLASLYPTTPEAVAFAEAQERLLFAMAVETARCVEEGVLRSVEDANIGSILGIGFPALYGGVLQYIDQYPGGVAGFVARADALAEAHGERFRPPALLGERAAAAGSLRAAMSAQAA